MMRSVHAEWLVLFLVFSTHHIDIHSAGPSDNADLEGTSRLCKLCRLCAQHHDDGTVNENDASAVAVSHAFAFLACPPHGPP